MSKSKKAYATARAAGLCGMCRVAPARAGLATCGRCIMSCVQRQKERDEQTRIVIFNHYGTVCACCSENCLRLLTLDHIDNDGNEHRKTFSKNYDCTGRRFYRWVIRNSFPTNLQTLCWNCNVGKKLNGGVCPHKEK